MKETEENKMVVRAEELLKKIEVKEKSILATLESDIDKALTEQFKGQQKADINISTTLWNDLTSSGRVKLIDKYRNAGWDVKHSSDSEQGIKIDYLTFNYKPN
jgi:hypothetical protein